MIQSVVAKLAVFTIAVVGYLGYGGVVLLMAIESACIPLPSEIIMPLAGYHVYLGNFTLHGAALAGAIGCVVGSVPAYYLGQYGGRPLIERYGRYVLVSHHDLDLADRLFRRWGQWVVFAARLLPVVRTFIAFPAGVSRMPMGKFIAFTFAGSYPWCLALAWAGAKLGDKWDSDPRLKAVYHRFEIVIVVAGVAAVVFYVWHKVRAARRDRTATVETGAPDEV
ncbi:DedA family protein [Anaeromyxobacter terrae]|uniref:DedA family protein n=1 Tax=Anaeromyxobacter terrae TaxID=2925406 RepID=UPI001F59960A|nr:DedA family protein [Anaeromyxobacter sp. SG22]